MKVTFFLEHRSYFLNARLFPFKNLLCGVLWQARFIWFDIHCKKSVDFNRRISGTQLPVHLPYIYGGP